MPKCDFNKVASNFIEITLRHWGSPVNLLHNFRTHFSQNTSGQLLLDLAFIIETNPCIRNSDDYSHAFSFLILCFLIMSALKLLPAPGLFVLF